MNVRAARSEMTSGSSLAFRSSARIRAAVNFGSRARYASIAAECATRAPAR